MKVLLSKKITCLLLLFLFSISNANAKSYSNEEQYLLVVDKMPALQGGFESLMKKITYPALALKTKTQGKVYLMLYISENGDVDEVKVIKGIGAGCDEEAIKGIKNSKFTPGIDKGAPVKTKIPLAVNFLLPS